MKHLLLVLGLSLLVLVTTVTTQAQEQPARLRVVHASPNAQDVDVLVDGEVAFSNVPFDRVTDYNTLPAGSRTITVVPTGVDEPVLAELPAELQAGEEYSMVIAGKPPLIEPLLLVDNNTLPSDSQARLRFIHVSPNIPEVDLTRQGGAAFFSNVAYKNSGTYISVTPGTYDLEVQIAGTGVAALSAPEISLEGGQVYTIFLTGSAGGVPPLQTVLSVDAPETEVITPMPVPEETTAPAPTAATTPAPTEAATATPAVVADAADDDAPVEEDEEGVEPATMPTTGAVAAPVVQSVLLGLGIVVVVAIIARGVSSTRRRE